MKSIERIIQHIIRLVASPAEAWIEITTRGFDVAEAEVASPAEAWIEICATVTHLKTPYCRLPCGGVD